MVAQPNDGDGSKKSFARSAYAIFARMPMVDHNTNDVNVMKAFNAVCFHILTQQHLDFEHRSSKRKINCKIKRIIFNHNKISVPTSKKVLC